MARADLNKGGALLEFSIRTAMHGTSCVSSAISVWNNQQNLTLFPQQRFSRSMGKALDYRS